MKKLFAVLCLVLLIAVFFASGCDETVNSYDNNDNVSDSNNSLLDVFVIKDDGSFSLDECRARGLEDKVIMVESKYCGHCKDTLPLFEEACREKGVEYVILDLTKKLDRELLDSYNIEVQYTPTFLFGCDYYVGTSFKYVYLSRLDKFLEKNA